MRRFKIQSFKIMWFKIHITVLNKDKKFVLINSILEQMIYVVCHYSTFRRRNVIVNERSKKKKY